MKIVDEIVTPTEEDRATEIDEIDRERQDRREVEAAIEDDHEIGKDRESARREEGETARERDREGENRMTISMRKWNASDKKIND